ncbi:hypothetical protein Athai_47210 [Actinocatenispora thailandica]|uniref:Uncharacterized protein n=1 Tax=Actinocatenispora thailandica TaxID=227318 RepID=A0A7R7HYL5_9ACTN|nr:hypothetical protein [Actinocatenispora thailandica]BCJ37218.1 hypothetical protein Athai_47210 [Actinocatenispora thailandica]
MPNPPTPEWTVEDYLEWLQRPFEYLHFQWVEQDGEKPEWERVCRPDFLTTLDLDDTRVDTDPDLRVLRLFLVHVDERITNEDERREWLLDEDKRRRILTDCIDEDRRERAESVRRLDWVTPEQGSALSALGADWRQTVPARLDQIWAGWSDRGPEELVGWLDDWIPTLTGNFAPAPAAPPPPGTPESFTWVGDEARAALGDGWRETIRSRIDRSWAEWKQADDTQLAQWLRDWMPTLTGNYAAPPVAPPPPETPQSFSWVTKEQRDLLGKDWRDLLRRSLDHYYAAWPQQTDLALLTTWLDGWMPVIRGIAPVAPVPPPAQKVAQEPAPASPQSPVERVTGQVTEQVVSGRADLTKLVPERAELEEIVAEVVAERLAARAA